MVRKLSGFAAPSPDVGRLAMIVGHTTATVGVSWTGCIFGRFVVF